MNQNSKALALLVLAELHIGRQEDAQNHYNLLKANFPQYDLISLQQKINEILSTKK
jgi:hypothetical protein